MSSQLTVVDVPGTAASIGIAECLVSDDLWAAIRSVLPPAPRRQQGGGRSRVSDRDVLAAIVYVVVTDTSWRQVPPVFGASWQTVHRRFTQWTHQGVWPSLLDALAQGSATTGDRRAPTRDLATCRAIIARVAEGVHSGQP
ncbi:transposase [Streptomyces griseoviridis]